MHRILFVQPYASKVGGVDTVLLELIKGLDKCKFQSHVVLPEYSPYVEKYEQLGAKVHFLKIAVFGRPTHFLYFFINFYYLITSLWGLSALVKDLGIDLIHSHKMETMGPNLVARLKNIPAVQTVHELPRKPLLAYKFVAFLNHLLNNRVIVLCDRSAEMFRWLGNSSPKLRKIYNGISLLKPDTVDERSLCGESLDIKPGDKVILAVGRLVPMKGFEYLLKAASRLHTTHPNYKYLIVGDTAFAHEQPHKQELFSLAQALKTENYVKFLGLRRDVQDIFALADLFVLPSIYDIFPTVILEAMRAGLPVVATDVGGVPEMIRGNGIIVTPGNTEQLAGAIEHILEGINLDFGLQSRLVFKKHFTAQTYCSETQALYEELLEVPKHEKFYQAE